MISSLLKNCARHVKKSGDFTELMRYLDILETTKNDEENLLLDYAQKVAFKREIKNMISEEYDDFKEKIFRTVNEIHKSKIELEHIESVSKCQCGYIARWERARQSQNRLKISRVEQFYYHTMKDIKRNIENEAVAHNEVKNFIKEQSEATLHNCNIRSITKTPCFRTIFNKSKNGEISTNVTLRSTTLRFITSK